MSDPSFPLALEAGHMLLQDVFDEVYLVDLTLIEEPGAVPAAIAVALVPPLAVVGIGLQAMIAVRLHRHETTQVERFRAYAEQLPEVVAFYHMAGNNDFLVHVVVRDSDHLRDIAMGAFTAQPEVAHIETSIIFEHTRFRRLPDYE